MTDKPPCECIEQLPNGSWTWRCECSNGGDAEGAAYWCATANAAAELTRIKAENAELLAAANKNLERAVDLTAENVRLRIALEPFARLLGTYIDDEGVTDSDCIREYVTVGHVRAAARALKES